ncbi:MAG: type secretory pathway VirB3 family protein [Gammaproteobacteria bacterium]|nr:type secretory pathway VirB3 family protein [Gammaproteobacteria bacterium]
MSTRNTGLRSEPLFVGATSPPMRWGVAYAALLFNLVFTMEAFLLTKNLLTLLLSAPIHGICMLLCARDARFFDLVLLWGRTRMPALLGNLRVWKASSYSPLDIDLASGRGGRARARRATLVEVRGALSSKAVPSC